MKLKLADTALAKWLHAQMADYTDPETGLRGASQAKMAELAGVSQTQVHKILKHGHVPSPGILITMARNLGIEPQELFSIAYLNEEKSCGE